MDLINYLVMYSSINKNQDSNIMMYIIIMIYLSQFCIHLFESKNFKLNKIINNVIDRFIYKTIFSFKIELAFNKEYACYRQNYSSESEAILWKYIHDQNIQKKINRAVEYPINMEIRQEYKSQCYFQHYKLGIQKNPIEISDDIFIQFFVDNSNNNGKNNNKNSSEVTSYDDIIRINMYIKSKNKNCNEIQSYINKLYIQYNNWKDENNYNKKSIYFTSLTINNKSTIFNKYDFKSNKTFDNLFFENKELIINRLDEYTNLSNYKKLGIPHTLGFLFHGEPGCGKTSCIKAIANYLDRHIVCINLSHIFDINDLRKIFLNNRKLDINHDEYDIPYTIDSNKRLYVFEEIDCNSEDNILCDRNLKNDNECINENTNNPIKQLSNVLNELNDNVSKSPKDCNLDKKNRKKNITLGEILELLDGIAETDDRIIIFTTNFPDKLDKALIRPGRIDMILEFKKLRKIDIRDNFKLWFNLDIPKDKYNKLKDGIITQAEFGKLCFENKSNPLKIIDLLIQH